MHKIVSANPKKGSKRILIAKAVDCHSEVIEFVLQDLDKLLTASSIEAYTTSEYHKSLDTDLFYANFDKEVTLADYATLLPVIQNLVNSISDKSYLIDETITVFPFGNSSKVEGFYRYDLQFGDKEGATFGKDLPDTYKPFINPWIETAVEQEFDLPAKDCTLNCSKYGKDGFPLVIKSEKTILASKMMSFLKGLNRSFKGIPVSSNLVFTMAM